jgi:glyoxylase I family protein
MARSAATGVGKDGREKMTKLRSVHHLALTVTDVDRSVPWYARVLELEEFARRDDTETGLRKVVLRSPGDEFAVVLVQHSNTGRRAFDERRTGLDHVAFKVSSRAELAEWEERLDEYGVTYSPAEPSRTLAGSTVIVFRDPDGIQLEIWADPEP